MEYMTNKMLQRFMSNMTTALRNIQADFKEANDNIVYEKSVGSSKEILASWYVFREMDRKEYIKNSNIQKRVKSFVLNHALLQQMEKVVIDWITCQQVECEFAYIDYQHNRYDTFYRNRTKEAKKKLAKLVELQQAIRKQKSITKY